MDSTNQTPNVLLVTLAAQGHLNPILRLGKRLVSKNLRVTLATTHSALKNRSSAATSVGGVHLEFFSDSLPIDYNQKANIDYYMDTLTSFGPENLLALIRSHSCKFVCVIHTPFLPWVADVAAEVGIPSAMLWIQPSTLYQIYYRFYNQLDEFPTKSNPNLSVKLPGLPDFSAEELPSFVLPSNNFRSFDSILNKVFHNIHKVKWVLGNSFMELEKDVIASLNDAGHVFLPVGPIVPATLFGMQDEGFDLFKLDVDASFCLEWLNKQNPSSAIYISFGTLIFSSETEIESIAAGLKNTNRPFLWVIRPQETRVNRELESASRSVVASVSRVFCDSLRVELVVRKRCSGCTRDACPKWTDQPTNAKLVSDVWGVGMRLKKSAEGVVSAQEVERCVEEVMGGPRAEEFRKNAAKLKTTARDSLADGGSSDKNTERFVNEVISTWASCSSELK